MSLYQKLSMMEVYYIKIDDDSTLEHPPERLHLIALALLVLGLSYAMRMKIVGLERA